MVTPEDVYGIVLDVTVIVLAILVFFMQAGFALVEAGSVRSKNTTNILLKNVLDSCFGVVVFYAFGYAFLFGEDSGGFIGSSKFFLNGTINFPLVFYHFVFAATSATIVSGAMAERATLFAYMVFTIVMTGFIYPVSAHWAWYPSGWLADMGFIDTAGSAVVHVVGGSCAFSAVYFLGPRLGRFDEDGKPQTMVGHSTALVCLGAFVLWFGFFAFNASSALFASSLTPAVLSYYVGKCVVNTALAGGAGGLTVLFFMRRQNKRYSLGLTLFGIISGLVGVCAGCINIQPWAALIIGATCGMTYIGMVRLMLRFQLDDPVDAVAIHFGSGTVGTILVGFFNDWSGPDAGVFYGGGRILGVQLLGWLTVTVWSLSLSMLVFYILKTLRLIRIPKDLEVEGLDTFWEPAYPEQYAKGEFLKFREFIETSTFFKDFQSANQMFSAERGQAGLSGDARPVSSQESKDYLGRERKTEKMNANPLNGKDKKSETVSLGSNISGEPLPNNKPLVFGSHAANRTSPTTASTTASNDIEMATVGSISSEDRIIITPV